MLDLPDAILHGMLDRGMNVHSLYIVCKFVYAGMGNDIMYVIDSHATAS